MVVPAPLLPSAGLAFALSDFIFFHHTLLRQGIGAPAFFTQRKSVLEKFTNLLKTKLLANEKTFTANQALPHHICLGPGQPGPRPLQSMSSGVPSCGRGSCGSGGPRGLPAAGQRQ